MTDAGSSLDMDERQQLAERVGTDLSRKEQETGIDWFNSDERLTVTSYSGTIIRSLLKHSEARIRWLYVTGAADATGRVTEPSKLLDDLDIDIEGIQATLPVGSLSIKGTVRSSNKDSGVVTTPESVENLGEAFTDGGTHPVDRVGITEEA